MAAMTLPTPPGPVTGGLAPEALNGNSLTQRIRALLNYLESQGQQTFGYGQDIVGAGVGGAGAASDTADTAMDTLNPALKYWQGVLSGGKEAQSAIAPIAGQVSKNLTGSLSDVSHGMPQGGYSAALRSSLPFAAAGKVNDSLLSLQPTAATNIKSISDSQANIGGLRAQIAQILGQLGLGTMGQGSNLLTLSGTNALNMRGQDVNEHGQAMSLGGQLGSQAMQDVTQGYIANLYKPH